MNEKKQYCGLDLLKFIMAVLVAARHMIQVFYPAESRWRLVIGSWLSNLAGGRTLCLAHCEAVSALVRDLLAH